MGSLLPVQVAGCTVMAGTGNQHLVLFPTNKCDQVVHISYTGNTFCAHTCTSPHNQNTVTVRTVLAASLLQGT